MDANRKRGVFAGILFITAMITSLLGGGLLESVLSTPDYITNIPVNSGIITMGIILELINAIAVIGIAAALFPVIKPFNESLALGYAGFRIVESFLCALSAFIPLLLLSLSVENSKTALPEVQYIMIPGNLLLSARSNFAEIFIPLFFSIGAVIFYYLLFKSRLIPLFISAWGFIGAILIFIQIFIHTGILISLILVLPIITNEIFLGIWLIAKGFNKYSAITDSVS